MVCHCRTHDDWTPDHAEQWWKAHLPELTGPLDVSTTRQPTAGAVSV
jgi:hypothetical protein